ncbi:hypothetical protein [Amycolatopsis thermoflava]|uniref:hypothetical protein n=1 Tax=Amycolatopsis thermoflava TaxID=84480 RepID=UPI0036690AB6
MIVGGRELSLDKDTVLRAMKGVDPEPFRRHVVEIGDTVYPPKQVLAQITGWERTSFTTMEAQRVLSKVGFTCRRVGLNAEGRRAWLASSPEEPTIEDRVAAVERAIVALTARIDELAFQR